MKALRWISFIPVGILLGFLFAFPIIFFYNIWNLDNLFFTSVVKNGFSTYFIILCMAWIAPNTFGYSGFKILVSIIYGVVVAVSSLGLLTQPEAQGIMGWEYAGEVVGMTLGYLSSTQWDKHSVRLLLSDTKAVHPYNTYTHKPIQSD